MNRQPVIQPETTAKPEEVKTDIKSNTRHYHPKLEPKSETTSAIEEQKHSKLESKNSNIHVYIPIGIPGMGKTHFATNVLQKSLKEVDAHCHFTIISYDQIRKPGLDKWLSANLSCKIDEALVATATETTEKWQSVLKETLMRASNDTHSHYIFLDKNFPLSDLAPTQNVIRAFE